MKSPRLYLPVLPCLLAVVALRISAQGPAAPPRPKILGVAHIGLRTDDLAAARKFYGDVLGYQEPFTYDRPASQGGGLLCTYFKVNDHQYIEVFPELKDPKQDRLSDITYSADLRAGPGAAGARI